MSYTKNNIDYFTLGCPRILRVDMGTENYTLAIVQPILRHFDSDYLAGGKSFMYGKSINNQVQQYLQYNIR